MAYNKTENLKSWKAGQSGNPAGKAKGTLNRSTIVKKWLEAAASDGEGLVADQLVRALIKKAAEGDVAAFRELMDSTYGKITDKNEIAHSYVVMPSIKINGADAEFDVGN